jgi:membrane protease YdiL (CAAX protease family)
MRVKPRAIVGVGIWLLYVAIIVVLAQLGGVAYDEIGDSASNIVRGVLPSLVVGGLVVAVLARRMGWWSAAMRDEHRTRAWWVLIAPGLALLAALANFGATDWGSVTVAFFTAALALGIAVGFAEELVCRGVLLVGLRGTFREVGAWALSCLVFGFMHTVNIFLGAPPGGTVGQVISSAMAGSTFYLLRRYFGSLLPAMFLHGLWDMSIFVQQFSGSEGTILALLEWPAGIIAVFAGLVVALRTQRGAQESYAASKATAAPVTS